MYPLFAGIYSFAFDFAIDDLSMNFMYHLQWFSSSLEWFPGAKHLVNALFLLCGLIYPKYC